MRAITRRMTVFGLASLLALLSCALLAAGADAAPIPVSPPSISPAADSTTTSPQEGDTLTEVAAQWTPPPTSTTYQWLDCDSTGTTCTPITGATNNTYTLTSNDVGSTIEVQEIASDGIGSATQTSGPTLVVVPLPPVNTALPSISGTFQDGQQLTVTQGSWTNNPTSISDQWRRCDNTGSHCSDIDSATGPTYTLTSADIGVTIKVRETASNAGGSGHADSAQTPVIAQAPHIVPTTTSLLVVPDSSITNQTSTLVATVTSDSAAVPPSGAVAFLDGGAPISGCAHVAVNTPNQSVNVTCATAFSAATSPEQLTAAFTPADASRQSGSQSLPVTLPVGRDSTTTSLDVSNPTLNVGSEATYTATVAAAHQGPFRPSGSVQFFDHGKPMTSCTKHTLVLVQGFESVQCTVRYRRAGTHEITALYDGNGAFSGSAAQQTVTVRPKPPQVLGTITTRMAWKFRYTPSFTTVLAMVARQARPGTKITVFCRGRHCPFAKRSMKITKATGCGRSKRHSCLSQKDKKVDLKPLFGGHRLPAGSHITIELTHPHWIGKAYLFTIRAGKAPTSKIGCLGLGSTQLGVNC